MIYSILIGILAGFIVEKILNRNDPWYINLLIGIIGSVVGYYVFGLFGIQTSGIIGNIIASVCGALLALFIYSWVSKRT